MAMLRKVQDMTWIPEWLAEENLAELKRTPEFWFSRPAAGAKLHVDSHIQTTIAIQLAGRKTWRIGFLEPRETMLVGLVYSDGQRYESPLGPWVAQYAFEMAPGDVLVMPPGFAHETKNTGDGCALSLTHQFSRPFASRLYREFWPRVRRTGDVGEVLPEVVELMGLGKQSFNPLSLAKSAVTREALEQRARALAEGLDGNEDGVLAAEECGLPAALWSRAELWFDTNEDGAVAVDEYVAGFAEWAEIEQAAFSETPQKLWVAHYDMDAKESNAARRHTRAALMRQSKREL